MSVRVETVKPSMGIEAMVGAYLIYARGMTPEELAATFNANKDGYNSAMALHFVRVSADEVVAEIEVAPQHLQAYGIVHGGVYCSIIETVCSVGGAVYALPNGQGVVGLDNHTSFLKATRSGKLTFTGKPLSRGRSTQVWETNATNEKGELVASGRVRLFTLAADRPLAGKEVKADPEAFGKQKA